MMMGALFALVIPILVLFGDQLIVAIQTFLDGLGASG